MLLVFSQGGCVMLNSWSYLVHESLLRLGLQSLAVLPSFFSCLWEAREGLHHVYGIHYFCSSCGVVAHCLWKGEKSLPIYTSLYLTVVVFVLLLFQLELGFLGKCQENLAISCSRGSHGRLACVRLPRKQLQQELCA